ncbi:hypothetical protein QVD17_25623 [Tagetes erecta]|uniref:Uncharacterized protein n=1 Tax=Tagetes erecta TaxID=13708 RepID=A0AAD8KGJ2_TARER|nr:hypothetical protein QVD17_25623 [Tagetes erecta]
MVLFIEDQFGEEAVEEALSLIWRRKLWSGQQSTSTGPCNLLGAPQTATENNSSFFRAPTKMSSYDQLEPIEDDP